MVQTLNSKIPKSLHLEPVVRTSDYYFSKIGEVPQFTFLTTIYDLPLLGYLQLSTDLSKSANIGSELLKPIKTIETKFYNLWSAEVL